MKDNNIERAINILALDASGASLACAVLTNSKTLNSKLLNISNQHSVNLLPALDAMLKEINLDYQDLHAIAVSVGPGSFTGIRIGIATANTLGYGLSLPVFGVSSLEALAYPYRYNREIILPVFDARGGRLYGSIFQQGQRVVKDQQFVEQDLAELFSEIIAEQSEVLILGDGLKVASDLLQKLDLKLLREDREVSHIDYVNAENIGLLAWRKISKQPGIISQGFVEPVLPNYCVKTQAERNLLQKQVDTST